MRGGHGCSAPRTVTGSRCRAENVLARCGDVNLIVPRGEACEEFIGVDGSDGHDGSIGGGVAQVGTATVAGSRDGENALIIQLREFSILSR